MNKALLLGLILGATTIAGLAFMASQSGSVAGPRPTNFRKCEEKDYTLFFVKMDIDHDLEPGKPTKMTSVFHPHEDVHFEKMSMKVYLSGIKVFSVEDTKPAELKKDVDWVYDYALTLPKIVPHVKVTLKMFMYGGPTKKDELTCVAFDVQM